MKKIVSFLLFALINIFIFADTVLEVNNTNPSVNEPIALNVEFINSEKEDYTIDGIENFKILSKGVQRSYTIINGKKSTTILDKYTLLPTVEGTFTLQIKGNNESSNPLQIVVSKEKQTNNVNISDKISLNTEPKNREYYFGEKIPFEEKLLTIVSIRDIQYVDPPVFNNFSVKDIFPTEQNRRYPEKTFTTSEGRQGLELTLQQSILQPNSSGEKTIKNAHIAVVENSNPNDIWYYGKQPVVYLGGEEIKLNILPLPSNQPTGFQNVVGKLKGEFNWNRDEVNLGESILLTLKLYGDVNLDTLEKIIPYNIAGFNIFESVKNSSEKIIDEKYYSEKTFEIAFIPKTTDENFIPEIKIPYFDTETKSYKDFIIPSKNLKILGEKQNNISNDVNNIKVEPTQQKTVDSPKPKKNLEKVEIENIPEVLEENLSLEDHKYFFILYGIIIAEAVAILFLLFLLLRKKKDNKNKKYDFKSMKKAKDDIEFYELYCNLMKQVFDFSPKVHLEDRLVKNGASSAIVELNRDIEQKMYNLEPLNRKEIIKVLKKEIR